ncbi:hypothetical protein D3C72_2442940 [compost metagenome]
MVSANEKPSMPAPINWNTVIGMIKRPTVSGLVGKMLIASTKAAAVARKVTYRAR